MRAPLLVLVVAGCSSRPDVLVARELPAAERANAASVVASNYQFAVDLYHQLPAGNSFFSPFSISTAFAMLDAGAAGETDSQLREVLQLTLAGNTLNAAYGALLASLDTGRGYGNYTLATADRLFGQTGEPFVPGFLDITKNNYEAELQQLDFTNPSAATATIDQWVSSQTDGKIPMLFPAGSLNPSTRLVLANAILFKGTWHTPFDPSQTGPGSFAVDGGSAVTVPMMDAVDVSLSTAAIPGGTLALLPFQGGDLSFLVLLPSAPGGLAALEANLSAATLTQWIASATAHDGWTVEMPKFTLPTSFSLNAIMQALGAPDAFTQGVANFSGIDGAMDLSVGLALHDAWITVDEQGAEAAGATGIGGGGGGGGPPPSNDLDVAQSFDFGIYDNVTGSLLFFGHMVDPSLAPPQ